MNTDAIDKIFSNFHKLVDNYHDLQETKDAEENFWEYAEQNILRNTELNIREFENAFYNVTHKYQRQGFIYGFRYAVDLLKKEETLPK